MKIDFYTGTGEKKGTVEVSDKLFGAPINDDLMHRAVVRRLSNARTPIAHTKTRGEVAYTTKKLFRQKGTGNARRGAKSTNLLRGGGVTHGPRNNVNYTKNMPKKERRAALFSSLSQQAQNGIVIALERMKGEAPKTKVAAALVGKLPAEKNILMVIPEKDFYIEKCFSNLPTVRVVLASYLNPYDVLWAHQVVLIDGSAQKLEETFLTHTPK